MREYHVFLYKVINPADAQAIIRQLEAVEEMGYMVVVHTTPLIGEHVTIADAIIILGNHVRDSGPE